MTYARNSLLLVLLVLIVALTRVCHCISLSDVLEVVETQGKIIAELQAAVDQMGSRECGCQKAPPTTAFTVYMDTPEVASDPGKVIPLPKVRSNIGNAFSNVTSTFTVPMDGTYVFYAHLDCTGDYRVFRLSVNGRKQALAHNDVNDHSLSTYTILNLTEGDKVNLVHDRAGGRLDGGPESIFAGFRLGA